MDRLVRYRLGWNLALALVILPVLAWIALTPGSAHSIVGSSHREAPAIVGSSHREAPHIVGSSHREAPRTVGSSHREAPRIVGSAHLLLATVQPV